MCISQLEQQLIRVVKKRQALNFKFNDLYDRYKQKYGAKRGFKKRLQESNEYKNLFIKLENLEKIEMNLQDEIRNLKIELSK